MKYHHVLQEKGGAVAHPHSGALVGAQPTVGGAHLEAGEKDGSTTPWSDSSSKEATSITGS